MDSAGGLRRQRAGLLEAPYRLRAAQLIFRPDTPEVLIRLNEEVRATAQVSPNRAIEAGEMVMESDIQRIEDLKLLVEEEDCGHMTLLSIRGEWFIVFDFRYNKGKTKRHHDAAREFLETAEEAATRGRRRAVVENLLHAVESSGKAVLMETPGNTFFQGNAPKRNSHGHVYGALVKLERAEAIDDQLFRLLARLNELRGAATYLDGDFQLSDQECAELVASAKRLLVPRLRWRAELVQESGDDTHVT